MASLNKMQIIGNLGRDPETSFTSNNIAVTRMSVATTEKFKDKITGEAKEITEWHRVVFFGRLAEVAAEFLKKGATIYVEGKMRTRKWTDDKDIDRYSTEVVGHILQMFGSKPASNWADDVAKDVPHIDSNAGDPAYAPMPSDVPDLDDDIPL
jgi:single-strand DNA-binding protein